MNRRVTNEGKNGVPNRNRTCDLPLRRRPLYPTELPGHRLSRVNTQLGQSLTRVYR